MKSTLRFTRDQVFWFFVEAMASMSTLAGIWLGSTTAMGAMLYLISLIFWYLLTWRNRLWGLMPLNIATTLISALNLWAAMHQ